MKMIRRALLAAMVGELTAATQAMAAGGGEIVHAVRNIVERPEHELDYLNVKLAIDVLIDPALRAENSRLAVEAMAAAASDLAGEGANDLEKLVAVRTLIYRAGPWNDNLPFAYDHADPYGRDIRNKLLTTYIERRRGNCVSMPVLFLILADRLGVNVSLATAPLHVFVRHVDGAGLTTNLETTSGAMPARDAWYRENLTMTDEAVANGLYLRTLSRRESVALMATTVMEYLTGQGRYEDAIAVGDVILEFAPRDVETLVRRGSACGRLLERDFIDVYPRPTDIPPSLHPRYATLARENQEAFERAYALGWREAAE
jgi:regulator of sirC expression with transglutaminase-like and TPR domain